MCHSHGSGDCAACRRSRERWRRDVVGWVVAGTFFRSPPPRSSISTRAACRRFTWSPTRRSCRAWPGVPARDGPPPPGDRRPDNPVFGSEGDMEAGEPIVGGQVLRASRVLRGMHVTYLVTTILAALADGYAACLNFVGAESVKVVAD